MSDRDADAQRSREARRHAGNNLERDSVIGQVLGFLAAATKQEWIASLEADDHPAFFRLADEQFVNFCLSGGMFSQVFAHEDFFSSGLRDCQYFFLNKAVVDNNVSGPEQPHSPHSQKIRMSRASADQVDPAKCFRQCFLRSTITIVVSVNPFMDTARNTRSLRKSTADQQKKR